MLPNINKRLEDNKSLTTKLDADQQSKLHLKFVVKDKQAKAGAPALEPHQTFVRFVHSSSGREIVFMAQGAGGQYAAEVDFATQAKNFRGASGLYTLELVVSDALIDNPVRWRLGDLSLQLIETATPAASGEDKASMYAKKPEIKHLFRLPEPTPPSAVSTLFSGLCLAPFGLLLIMVYSV